MMAAHEPSRREEFRKSIRVFNSPQHKGQGSARPENKDRVHYYIYSDLPELLEGGEKLKFLGKAIFTKMKLKDFKTKDGDDSAALERRGVKPKDVVANMALFMPGGFEHPLVGPAKIREHAMGLVLEMLKEEQGVDWLYSYSTENWMTPIIGKTELKKL